jgi:hypothetical protein
VSVPINGIAGLKVVYLVTARHVVESAGSGRIGVRGNSKSGEAVILPCGLGGREQWRFHPEGPSVDIAVIPFGAPSDLLATAMSTEDFGTPERLAGETGPGDDVFIVGLFSQFFGMRKNFPIVRLGSIAMMPDEKVPTSVGEIDAILVEIRSIEGMSGSPVFVRHNLGFYLLGVMHGFWTLPVELRAGSGIRADVNSGIAVVVPAVKILEILNQPFFQSERDKVAREFNKNGCHISQ